MRGGTAVAVLALLVVACGSSEPAATSSAVEPVEATTTTAPPAATSSSTTTIALASPGVAALTSGRGDDGSMEVGIWFAADPFTAGALTLLVGTDADDSYPGVGDPMPHIDAWAMVEDGTVSLYDGGVLVADESSGVESRVSWTGPGSTVWFYFIDTVPVRAGTVWVIANIDGDAVQGGGAGAPFGSSCSYHAAGVDLGSVPGDVPQHPDPCRYPQG